MTPSDLNGTVSVAIHKFPHNILIPGVDTIVSMQVTNTSAKEEKFRFAFEGENLNVSLKSDEYNELVIFKPGEVREIILNLTPTVDGSGKLVINIFCMKIVEFKVKVQKVRNIIYKSRSKKILDAKQFLPPFKEVSFNPSDYFVDTQKAEVKKLEKQIKSMKNGYESQKSSIESSDSNGSPSNGLKSIENQIKDLAKSYLSINELLKALEVSLELSNPEEKTRFYYNLIRAFASKNLEGCFQVINGQNDQERKNELIKNIALDVIDAQPENINNLITLVQEPSIKETILLTVVGKAIKKNTKLALDLSRLIIDETKRIRVLFDLLRIIQDREKPEKNLIINQICESLLKSPNIDLSAQNYKNPAYGFLKDVLLISADLNYPTAVDSIIQNLENTSLKEKLIKDLFDDIYKMVDEIRTKEEAKVVFSQYYLLNTFVSKISKEIQSFSHVGGNISNNLLINDYNFNVALVSLFSLSFSIFPIIDRVYSDLKFNEKKHLAYYIYPSFNNLDEEELGIIDHTLQLFFPASKVTTPLKIFNLDFIPYVGKPTAILASNGEDLTQLKSKIEKQVGDRVKVVLNEPLFAGGQTLDNLKSIFYSNNFKVYNLVLSYEFLNDYEVLKGFMKALS